MSNVQITPGAFSYSVEQVISLTGFDRNRVYNLIKRGDLRTFKDGRRRFVSAKALSDCISTLERRTENA